LTVNKNRNEMHDQQNIKIKGPISTKHAPFVKHAQKVRSVNFQYNFSIRIRDTAKKAHSSSSKMV